MTRDKQIEEMARAIANKCEGLEESGCFNEDNYIGKCCNECMAEHLYEQGYRKQSEGEWKTEDTILGKCCVCSVCGSCPSAEYKFCPYCGAKMKGGE